MNDQPNSNEIDAKDPRVARREKMRQIEELGLDPWGSRFDDRSLISDCQARQPEIQWTREDRLSCATGVCLTTAPAFGRILVTFGNF